MKAVGKTQESFVPQDENIAMATLLSGLGNDGRRKR